MQGMLNFHFILALMKLKKKIETEGSIYYALLKLILGNPIKYLWKLLRLCKFEFFKLA